MCFSEFIGYTCGHSSPEVLRPCPMTTQFYTNPLCTKHARRPILAPEMCPACQRVIHGRAVLITEWEHRWMHERGVCGCEVQFPDLIRPRVVTRSRPGQAVGKKGQVGNNTRGLSDSGTSSMSLPKARRGNTAGAKGVPAQYQERPSETGRHNLEVAVRIPSFYGAEWVGEHRQLHTEGSCKCPGDFSFYNAPDLSPNVASSSAAFENVPGQVAQTEATSQEFQDQSQHWFQDTGLSHPSNPASPSNPGPSGLGISQGPPSPNEADRATTPKPPPLVVSSCYPYAHGPQRSPGAIYEVDPAKSTNRLYNQACSGGARLGAVADFQSVEFPRAEGTLPLVGLPIGAGPEGAPGLSHVGSFQDCVIHTRNLIARMGDGPAAGLLATKSKSFACLDALKAEVEEGLSQQEQA